MNHRTQKVIVITGGPGGGKSSLLADIRRDPGWSGRIVILPEAIHAAVRSSVNPREPVFQRWVVNLQKQIEQAAADTFAGEDRVLLTHRGTLDPLAFCRANGWTEDRFWQITSVQKSEWRNPKSETMAASTNSAMFKTLRLVIRRFASLPIW